MKRIELRRIRRFAVLGSLLVTAIFVVPAAAPTVSPVRAGSTDPPSFEDLRATAELEGPTLVSGKFIGDSDAAVRVYAIPPVDASSTDVPVAIGTSSATRFNAVADPSVDLTRFVNESGVVDFRVVATTSDMVGMWVFSRELDANGRPIEPTPEPATTMAEDPTADGAAGPAIRHDVEIRMNDARAGTDGGTASNGGCGSYPCGYTCEPWGGHYEPKVHVGQGFHRSWGAVQWFSYKIGAENTLGWGTTIEGNGWELGGKVERTNRSEYGIAWRTEGKGKKYLDTHYGYQVWNCRGYNGNPGGYTYQEARAEGLLGGATKRSVPSAPSAKYCVPHGKNTRFHKTTTTASAWTNGVRLPFINTYTQTGYTAAVGIHTSFKRKINVCGRYNYPASGPGIVVYGLCRC